MVVAPGLDVSGIQPDIVSTGTEVSAEVGT
jgi:hypothetical protein